MTDLTLQSFTPRGASVPLALRPETPRTPDAALLALARALQAAGYRFTTVTPATHDRVNRRPGNQWAIEPSGIFGWSRPFRVEQLAPEWLVLMRQAEVLERYQDGWLSRVRFSSLGRQLFVHSAYPTAETDAVFFGPDTYRFAQAIQAHLAGRHGALRRAADIGCGAGPGAVLIAQAQPTAEVLALDINPQALRFTRLNAELAGVAGVQARHSDLLSAVEGDFDLIVANPPYMADPAQRAYRDGGGELGAGLSRAIVEAALPRLAPGGSLLLYTGVAIVAGRDLFRQAIAAQLDASGWRWTYREVDPDVFGEELQEPAYGQAERIAAVVLEVKRP